MTGLRSEVPTIDVILPAYNAEKTIVEALRSLQDQTFTDFRVLVVNDGSTDDTASIVSGMAEADPRIVLLSQPNGGIVDALN
ncbi:MAG: glycosyltransferase, partial [Oxalobacteraceae bacterium]